MINLLIIHYNTPVLTECLIKSINICTPECKIYIFDNSDIHPFSYRQDNIVYLDNTKGQYINFDEWIKNYPNRFKSREVTHNFGSAKHCYTVEKCMDIIGENFILLDSDILLKKDISVFNDPNYIFVGTIEKQPSVFIKRLIPFICFINVEMCKKYNIHYFDEDRMHGLCNNVKIKNADHFDTGASFYFHSKFYQYKVLDYREYIEHFKGGSWEDVCSKREKKITSTEWINLNEKLWNSKPQLKTYTLSTSLSKNIKSKSNCESIVVKKEKEEIKSCAKNIKVLLCAIGKMENNYIREWVEHHKNMGFTKIVLYDNNDKNGEHFTDVIDDYVKNEYVIIEDCRGVELAQVPSYNNCYEKYKNDYDWICFWDIDEFINFNNYTNIIDFLSNEKFKDTQCIRLCWKQYTDNGLLETKGDYSIKRFTEVLDINYCKKSGISLTIFLASNRQCKSIFRTNVDNFNVTSPHCFIPNISALDATGKPCKNDGVFIGNKPVWDGAWLNHYRFKTISEYVTQKMVRLWPTEYGNGGKDILNISYFFKFNKKTPQKEELAKKLLSNMIEKKNEIKKNVEVLTDNKPIIITSWVKRKPNGCLYHNNWGDELNFYLIPLIFNREVIDYKNDTNENFACIGSILNDTFITESTIIWGSGTQDTESKLTKIPKKVCAVRGPLTRKFLLESGISCPEIYGDPALLLPRYYHPKISKKYKIGFIPHWESINSENAIGFGKKDGVHMIKMKGYKKWTDVIDEILSCEYIVSESLHGLIVAEAYGIPNLWINITLNKYEIKFHDFFLSIGKDRTSPIKITKDTPTQLIDVFIKSYKPGHINLEPLINACPIIKKENINNRVVSKTENTQEIKKFKNYNYNKTTKEKPIKTGCDVVKKIPEKITIKQSPKKNIILDGAIF